MNFPSFYVGNPQVAFALKQSPSLISYSADTDEAPGNNIVTNTYLNVEVIPLEGLFVWHPNKMSVW